MATTKYTTRLVTLIDGTFLREMLCEAAAPRGNENQSREQLLSSPQITAFVDQWGRPGDHGFIAEAAFEPVGAAWFRVFPDDDPEGGFVGGETPELLIAVVPEHRGKGVGSLLLEDLLDKARFESKTTIGLNVEADNVPAVALFRSHGFETLRERNGILTMQAVLGP